MTKPPSQKRKLYRIHCPHCRAICTVRSSRQFGETTRELHVVCTNEECGHVFGASAEVRVTISHTIRPSRIPSADVKLRQVSQRPRAANDSLPEPANDTRGSEVPRSASGK